MDEKTQDSAPELATTDFVTVFEGNPAEAQVLQTVLEDQGFDVLVANHTIKAVDPFITGPGMFDMTLQVPAGQAADAVTALRLAREQRGTVLSETEGGLSETEGGLSETEAGISDTEEADKEEGDEGSTLGPEDAPAWNGDLAGRRLRWGSALLGVLLFVPPIAIVGILVYAFCYIDYGVRSRRLESPPAQHGMTKASVILVVGWATLAALAFFGF